MNLERVEARSFFVLFRQENSYIRSANITKHMDYTLLEKYKRQFSTLNPNKANGRISPHKPVLVLAVIELIRNGKITDGKINVNDHELVEVFSDYWLRFAVPGNEFNFVMPFFHLRTSSFWKLVPHKGKEEELRRTGSLKSIKRINELLQHAELATDLFDLLQNRTAAEQLSEKIIETYFPEGETASLSLSPLPGHDLSVNDLLLTNWILPIHRKSVETKEQFISLRNAAFRKLVLQLYGYTCAISGINSISSLSNMRLTDACHIVPFSNSETETLTNGIVLTPTLHKAFDAGFITIDEHYRVKVSSTLKEQESAYMLNQFDGKGILLPVSREHYPSMKSLEWHWENRFIS